MLTEFYNRMKILLNQEDYEEFVESLQEKAVRGLVVNNKKIDIKSFLNNTNLDLTALPYDECCFVLNSDDKVGDLPIHHAGGFYMQEPSAMVAGLNLPIKDGDIVLDACASPGGKTFQIARRDNCCVISNEIDFSRAKILQSNVERLGLENVIVTNFTTEELNKLYPNTFDALLIDAPCSGEGMFRREEQAKTQWSQEYVQVCAKRQIDIIKNLDNTLKQGGYLMYSTCTYSLEENEYIAKQIVDLGYEIVELKDIKGAKSGFKIDNYATDYAKRFYPHSSFGEGQFVCLLKKVKTNYNQKKNYSYLVKELQRKESIIFNEFVKENLNNDWLKLYNSFCIKDSVVYYCPNKNLISDVKKVLSYGVKLGEINKDYFKPDHNFFTCFGNYFKRHITLDDKNATLYLKGYTFNTDIDNGWAVVNVLGASLGGVKVVNGLAKNHYPKGLRIINKKS